METDNTEYTHTHQEENKHRQSTETETHSKCSCKVRFLLGSAQCHAECAVSCSVMMYYRTDYQHMLSDKRSMNEFIRNIKLPDEKNKCSKQ